MGDESEVGRKERDVTKVISLLLNSRHYVVLKWDQNRFSCKCEDLLFDDLIVYVTRDGRTSRPGGELKGR